MARAEITGYHDGDVSVFCEKCYKNLVSETRDYHTLIYFSADELRSIADHLESHDGN